MPPRVVLAAAALLAAATAATAAPTPSSWLGGRRCVLQTSLGDLELALWTGPGSPAPQTAAHILRLCELGLYTVRREKREGLRGRISLKNKRTLTLGRLFTKWSPRATIFSAWTSILSRKQQTYCLAEPSLWTPAKPRPQQ